MAGCSLGVVRSLFFDDAVQLKFLLLSNGIDDDSRVGSNRDSHMSILPNNPAMPCGQDFSHPTSCDIRGNGTISKPAEYIVGIIVLSGFVWAGFM